MDIPSTSCTPTATSRSKRKRVVDTAYDELSDEEEVFQLDELDDSSESENYVPSDSENEEEIVAGDLAWRRCEEFIPKTYNFDDSSSGISDLFSVDETSSAYDYFVQFFDNDLTNIIVEETNRYFRFCADAQQRSKRKQWHDTTIDEIYSFLALILLMPHVKKHNVQDYWSMDPMIETDFFRKYMSRDRFLQLLRYLHFSDNTNPSEEDRLWKIRNIFVQLNDKFRSFVYPFQKLVIDESLILFKGRLRFKQFIPSKRYKFGIKLFILCDCESGMILNILVYSGSQIDIPNDLLGVSGSVVKQLILPYLDKGHLLYTDNWYTDPRLALFLNNHSTGYCGTIKKNRRNFPKFTRRLQKGQTDMFNHNDTVLALKWKDKRDVYMITTFHSGKLENSSKVNRDTNEQIKKPICVLDYNINMRLVDKADMQISTVDCVRKSVKWYKKLFFHLLDIVLLNCYNMYLMKTGNNSLKLKDFVRQLISQILEKHGTLTAARRGSVSAENVDRLAAVNFAERHFPAHVPGTGGTIKGQRNCYVCMHTSQREKKRKLVTTWCPSCKIGLCIDNCFKIYHTRKYF